MRDGIRETSEQWDDVPTKVVGRQRRVPVNLEAGADFLKMGENWGGKRRGQPKGIFRFASHEEANQWQMMHQITR